ncbi:MAG TPA: patatin-like phospholipase family protein [Usitatibacteraceae bacterium]
MFRRVMTAVIVLLLAGCATFAPPVQVERMPKSVPVPPEIAAKTRWALALSGGSARGFAHIGVLRVLDEAGLKPDLVVGTSAGSIVGSLYASGLSVQQVEAAVRAMDRALFNDVVLPGLIILPGENGLIRGDKMMRFIDARLMTRHIEDFPIRFAAVATDMKSGEPMVFNSGHAALAVRASSSVPGVFTPVDINGRLYGDGQIVSPMPVSIAKQLGAPVVIAVDVVYPPEQSLLSNPVYVLFQAITISAYRLKESERPLAALVIRPELKPTSGQFSFSDIDWAIQAGEEEARKLLPEIRAAIAAAQ